MHTLTLIVLIVTTVLTGLLAGFFYAWSYSVMIGLKQTDDRTFITAMQKINIAILNPAFLIVFIGPLLGIFISIALLFLEDSGTAAICALIALIAFLAEFMVTMRKNQPMNIALDAAGEFENMDDPHHVRTQFEAPWVRWNQLRTATSGLAFLLMLITLTLYAGG